MSDDNEQLNPGYKNHLLTWNVKLMDELSELRHRIIDEGAENAAIKELQDQLVTLRKLANDVFEENERLRAAMDALVFAIPVWEDPKTKLVQSIAEVALPDAKAIECATCGEVIPDPDPQQKFCKDSCRYWWRNNIDKPPIPKPVELHRRVKITWK